MIGQIDKWGNSLAIRVPKAIAEQLNWDQKTRVRETIVDGKLVIETVQSPVYSLEQMLEAVTADNLHAEISTGPALGQEVW